MAVPDDAALPRAAHAAALQSRESIPMASAHDLPVADGTLADRLARCYTGVVYDVLRGRGIVECVLPPEIVPLDRAMVAAGPVFTVRGRPDASVSAHETLLRWTELLSR